MLDDSHIPIPYSTSIALPYTETNRLALKWLDALMLPPGVRKTGCTIHAGGVPLFTGLLEYESMEVGYASYTFGGRDMSGRFLGVYPRTETSYPDYGCAGVLDQTIEGRQRGARLCLARHDRAAEHREDGA